MSSARINDDKFVLDDNAAAVLWDDVHNCFGKIIEHRRAGAPRSDRAREIDVIDTADVPAGNHAAEFGLLIRRQFGRRGGPLFRHPARRLFRARPPLGRTLHCARQARAMLFLLTSGPAPGWALHCAGLAFGRIFRSARQVSKRTLSGLVRRNGRPYLLGRGQTAAARKWGRS